MEVLHGPGEAELTVKTNTRLRPSALLRRSVSRRAFGRGALVAMPAAVLTGCGSDDDPGGVRVGALSEFEAGAPVSFEWPGAGPCFAIALETEVPAGVGPDQSIVAFSTLCPHMGCPIDPENADPIRGQFGPCACHQSTFDMRREGALVRGRACANLTRIELVVRDGAVFAVGAMGLAFGQPLDETRALTTAQDARTAAEPEENR